MRESNGINLLKGIWSDLYSCAMWNHWSYYDKRVHIFEEYGDVNPKS